MKKKRKEKKEMKKNSLIPIQNACFYKLNITLITLITNELIFLQREVIEVCCTVLYGL